MDFLGLLLLVLCSVGLSAPVVRRLGLDNTEKLLALTLLSFLGVFLLAWAVYVFAWPTALLWAIPLLSIAGLAFTARDTVVVLKDRSAGGIIWGQLLVTGWSISWMALIVSYSGGGWSGDWLEHWQRTRFFTDRDPVNTTFLTLYTLPARPPLANVLTATFLQLTKVDFAHYQLVSTMLASLVFLPCALLAGRFARKSDAAARYAVAVLTVSLMVSPAFVQNATFTWTKLPAAFFVLGGLYFFLRAQDRDAPRAAAPLCAVSLTAGILTHYSAGIYALGLAVAWVGLNRVRWQTVSYWRQTFGLALISALLLAVWFGWSAATYGATTTFLSNSSVTTVDSDLGLQLWRISLNLRDTMVPHFLRHPDTTVIIQESHLGYQRDWLFQLYQVNLWFAFGSVGALAIVRAALRNVTKPIAPDLRFWRWFICGTVVLGVAAHGARDEWGLAHICLQPVILLGLTFLASRWTDFSKGWRILLASGAAVDLACGIALHFGLQSFILEKWLGRIPPPSEWSTHYSAGLIVNLRAKLHLGLVFFSESTSCPPVLVLALLGAILTLAVIRARHTSILSY